MSIADAPNSAAPIPPLTLAARRPGHAAMTFLLTELQKRSTDGATLHPLPDDLGSWLVGAEGEILVGQELSLLGPAWRVLHAVPAGSAGADIDHLAVGPPGVFVLNTKHHANRSIRVGTYVVWINGFQQSNYQAELLRRCRQVRAVLAARATVEVPVLPVLVFVRAKMFDRSGPQQVDAVTADTLIEFLQAQPAVLDPQTIDLIAAAAADPTTWGASKDVLDEPDPTTSFLELSTPTLSTPRSKHHTRSEAPARAPKRPVARLLRLAVALVISLAVLPAALAGVLALLGLYFQMLINR